MSRRRDSDPSGRDEILDLIAKLHKERNLTVILVSHSMEDVARYVERLIVMNHGTVAFDATPGEVFSHYKELEKIGLMAPQVTYVMEGLARRGVTRRTMQLPCRKQSTVFYRQDKKRGLNYVT